MIPAKTRQFIDDDSGATMVEAGITMSLFFLITFGAMMWALTLWQQVTLQHAVEMEARCAVLPAVSSYTATAATPYCGYFSCTSGQDCAYKQAFGLGASSSNFTYYPTRSNSGTTTSFCGSTFTASTSNYANKFSLSLIPGLPASLKARYCRVNQF